MFRKYIYGEKTGLLFEQYQELKKFIEEFHKIKIFENSKGYYIETIFTNEVKTLVFTEKKSLEDYIASVNNGNDSVIFTGKNHINGKIVGNGAIKNLKTNKITNVVLKENKIFKFEINIDSKNDVNELFMTLKDSPDIISENGDSIFKFYMDEDRLCLRRGNSTFICSFCCTEHNKSESYFCCDRCNFYLCIICFERYEEIMYDYIEEVNIGFESIYTGQAVSNFLLAIPRFILPMNSITHKTEIWASLYIKTSSKIGIVIEFGNFKGEKIKVKFKEKDEMKEKEYLTYYWTDKNNGIRFAEMSYEDYKDKKLYYAKESNRIFRLYPKKAINLKDTLILCNNGENSKKWESTEYNRFFNNCKDFVASFIRVTESARLQGEFLRGAHNSSSVVIPKVILDEIEANEKDYVNNFFEKVPLIGYVLDAINLTTNIKNYTSKKNDK